MIIIIQCRVVGMVIYFHYTYVYHYILVRSAFIDKLTAVHKHVTKMIIYFFLLLVKDISKTFALLLCPFSFQIRTCHSSFSIKRK